MKSPKRERLRPIESDLAQLGDRVRPEFQSVLAGPGSLRMLDSADLLRGAREVQIRHEEKIYRLQLTRNGKLILIK
jgi:hemin uptake protein HemP